MSGSENCTDSEPGLGRDARHDSTILYGPRWTTVPKAQVSAASRIFQHSKQDQEEVHEVPLAAACNEIVQLVATVFSRLSRHSPEMTGFQSSLQASTPCSCHVGATMLCNPARPLASGVWGSKTLPTPTSPAPSGPVRRGSPCPTPQRPQART